jgi:hypothetical protein
MIPKIIHYCWFGGNPLPDDAKKCIASWEKYFPDYEITEWNESNFDLACCDYVKEAYQAKKWAFVSDYARFWILYHYGGLYFDTDVEVIKPMDDLIEKGSFMGEEAGLPDNNSECNPGLGLAAAPGLGLAAAPGLGLYKEILDYYSTQHFLNPDGSINQETVVTRTSNILKRHGFKGNGSIECIDGVYIYPPEYFCPMNYTTGKLAITENTRSIHHYSATWHSGLEELIIKIERCSKGTASVEYKLRRIVSLPFRVVNKFKTHGLSGVVKTLRK